MKKVRRPRWRQDMRIASYENKIIGLNFNGVLEQQFNLYYAKRLRDYLDKAIKYLENV